MSLSLASAPLRLGPAGLFRPAAAALCLAALATGAAAQGPAHKGHSHKPHVHGLATLNVAVDGATLTVLLETPLDSLLGFEHRPRTAAQRQAAEAVAQQLQQPAAWLRPDAAAQCTLTGTELGLDALQPLQPGGKDNDHADVDATYTYTCAQPARLASLQLGLFDQFKRLQRIDAQVAGAQGQFKQTLRRPAAVLKLVR